MASHPSSNRDNTVTRSGRWFRSPTKRRARSLPKSDHSRQTNPARRMRSESRESSVRRNRVVKGQDIESLAASRTRSNASTNRSMSIGASPSTNNKKATPNNKYQSKSQKPKKSSDRVERERGRSILATNNKNKIRSKSASGATTARRSKTPTKRAGRSNVVTNDKNSIRSKSASRTIMSRRSTSPAQRTPKSLLNNKKGRSKSVPRMRRKLLTELKNDNSTPKAVANNTSGMNNIRTTRVQSDPVLSHAKKSVEQNTASCPKNEWRMAYDNVRKETYYYNRITRETTWTQPEEYDFYNMPKNNQNIIEDEDGESVIDNRCAPLLCAPEESNFLLATKSFGARSTTSSWTDGFTSCNDDSDDTSFPNIAKPAWKQITDPTTKRKYYCHRMTNNTRWEKPDGYDEERSAYKAAIKKHRCKQAHDRSVPGKSIVSHTIASLMKNDEEKGIFGAPIQQIYDSAISNMTSFVTASTAPDKQDKQGKQTKTAQTPPEPEPLACPNNIRSMKVDSSQRKHSFSRIRSTGQRGLLPKKKEKKPVICIQHEQMNSPASPNGSDGGLQTWKQSIAMPKETPNQTKVLSPKSSSTPSEKQRSVSLSKRQRSQHNKKRGTSNKKKIEIHHEQTAGNEPDSKVAAVVTVGSSPSSAKAAKKTQTTALNETRQETQDKESRSSSILEREEPDTPNSKTLTPGDTKSTLTFPRLRRLQCSKKAQDAELFGCHSPAHKKSTTENSKQKAPPFSKVRNTGQKTQLTASNITSNYSSKINLKDGKNKTQPKDEEKPSTPVKASQRKVSSASIVQQKPDKNFAATTKSPLPSGSASPSDNKSNHPSVVKISDKPFKNRRAKKSDKSICTSQSSINDGADSMIATTSFLSGLACVNASNRHSAKRCGGDDSTLDIITEGEDKYYIGYNDATSAGSYGHGNAALGGIPWMSEAPCSPMQAQVASTSMEDDYTENGTWETSTAWSERYYR